MPMPMPIWAVRNVCDEQPWCNRSLLSILLFFYSSILLPGSVGGDSLSRYPLHPRVTSAWLALARSLALPVSPASQSPSVPPRRLHVCVSTLSGFYTPNLHNQTLLFARSPHPLIHSSTHPAISAHSNASSSSFFTTFNMPRHHHGLSAATSHVIRTSARDALTSLGVDTQRLHARADRILRYTSKTHAVYCRNGLRRNSRSDDIEMVTAAAVYFFFCHTFLIFSFNSRHQEILGTISNIPTSSLWTPQKTSKVLSSPWPLPLPPLLVFL